MKYIVETSRSGYERLKEHFKDLQNISVKSHMLKHYIERHNNIELKEMRFSVKVKESIEKGQHLTTEPIVTIKESKKRKAIESCRESR